MYQYVDIYTALLAVGTADARVAVARRWFEDHADEALWLATRSAAVAEVPAVVDEELWRMYALSRVIDLLLLGSQAPPSDYAVLMTELGMRVVERGAFHPFFHEVVAIQAVDDPAAPPQIQRVIWPCLFLGNLLISRAGCAITAGRDHMDPALAASTTLYWAHRRSHRPVTDLSVGWGHNSQWRTRFRRDYWIDRSLHYNVDGHLDVRLPQVEHGNPAREELTADERVELLVHRCFVRTHEAHDDRWPYHDRLVETVA